ncbi:MAG: AsmA family protein [Gammaproteobacteria bacterium]|nr:AsmA family protein [Gammaproteobacteria bacterium]
MTKLLKVILWVVGAIVVLVVGLAIALPLLVDPNEYKDEIARLVENKTGRKLDIQGDLNLSIFPWLGVETGKVSLANPTEFGNEPMVQLDEASVRLRLLPLLSRQVEAGTILIKGLQLNLISDASGQTNWDSLAQTTQTGEGGEENTADKATEAGVAALSLQGFDIRDSSIRYRDEAAGVEYQLSNLNAQTGTIVPGKDVPLEISGTIEGNTLEQPETFDVNASINLEDDSIRLKDLTLTTTGLATINLKATEATYQTKAQNLAINDIQLDTEYGELKATLNAASATADLQQETAELSSFVLNSQDGKIEGQMAATGIKSQPMATGEVTLSSVNVIGLLNKLKVEHGLAPEMSVQNVSARGSFQVGKDQVNASLADVSMDAKYKDLTGVLSAPTLELDTGKQTFSAPQLGLDTPHGRIDASITGSNIVDAPQFSGSLKSSNLELKQLLQKIGTELDLEEDSMLSTATLETRFDVTKDSATLSELSAQVDDMKIRGSLSVKGFEKPVYQFDLDIDRLDLDDSSDSPSENSGQTQGNSNQGNSRAVVLIPVALLRDLNAQGSISIGDLKAGGLKMSKVEVGLRSQDGQVNIDPIKSLLYDGESLGTIKVDAGSEVPALAYQQDFTAVSVLPLLSDAEISDKLSGNGTLGFNFNTKGAATDQITKNLNGTAKLAIRDGAIKGFNIQQMLINARQLYLKAKDREQEIDSSEEDETRFSEMTGSLSIKDGIAYNDDLSIKSPLFRITGKGSADIAKETIDYLMTVNVVESFQGQGGKELEELKGIPIPVRVDGVFADPKFRIDVAGLIEAKAKEKIDQKIEEEKEEVKEKLKEKLEEKLGDKLKGLFD